MEYKVIQLFHFRNKLTMDDFVKKINEAIKDGWVPQGGISCWNGTSSQAMVREVEEEENK